MKVLLYSSTTRTTIGGVQGVYSALAAGLRRQGHDVVEAWGSSASPPVEGEWTVPLCTPRTWRGLPRPGSVIGIVRSLGRLLGLLRRYRPDIVHLHFVRFEALYFLVLRPLFGYRLVVTFHGSDLNRPHPVSARALPMVVRRADAVTVVSAPLRSQLHDLAPSREPIAVVPNGIDVAFWTAGERGVPTVPTVVAVGRLEPVKGLDVLIEAVRHLRMTHEVRLVVIGDGGERRALERQATEAGLNGAVTFTGSLGAEGVREAFRSASVLAMPSRSEGMPLVALEAMAAGLPVVATRVGGLPGLLPPASGALVAPEDPRALAEALQPYVVGSGRVSGDGREIVRDYSTEAMVEAYERLYRQAVPGRHAHTGDRTVGACSSPAAAL